MNATIHQIRSFKATIHGTTASANATVRRVLLCLLTLVLTIGAAPSDADDGKLSGRFLLGYRSVDIGGTEDKFKEDLNLDDGARLFELNFDFIPASDGRKFADRIQLDVNNFGGDPFESFRFSVQKYGDYDFSYQRTKSTYFYHDIILPTALADPRLTNGGDFHTFDFDRVRDTASLSIDLNRRAKLDVGFERFVKRGDSTTTLDISRDEFELDKPVEESYDEFNVGFQYAWPKVTLIVEERVRDYENDVEIFLPGFSLGENTTDATTLDFFFLDQPYAFESDQHTLRINAQPNKKLLIRGSAIRQNIDLDVEAEERSQGIAFNGQPFTTDLSGGGEIESDTELLDLDISWLVMEHVAIIGGVRRHQLDQTGRFDFGSDANRSTWDVETTGFELGVEANLSLELTVAAGIRFESRDVASAHVTDGSALAPEEETTDQDGFFGSLSWRPTKRLTIDAELEDSSYDEPFSLSSPTDRERYSLRARLRGTATGLYASGSYVAHRFENGASGWQAERDYLTLRLGYRQSGIDASVGYSLVEADRQIDQAVTTLPGFGGGVTFLFPVLYESDADFFDGRFRCRVHPRVTLGGDFRLYDNSGTFGIEREDLRGWIELEVGERYLLRGAYRTIDYDEKLFDFDDYDADVADLSVGYRW